MAIDTDRLMKGMLLSNALANVGGALSSLGRRGSRTGGPFQPQQPDVMGLLQVQMMQERSAAEQAQRGAIRAAAPHLAANLPEGQRAALMPLLEAAPEMAAGPMLEHMFRPPAAPNVKSVGGGWFLRDGELFYEPRVASSLLRQGASGRPIVNVQQNTGPTGIDYGDPEDGLVWQRDASGQVMLDERGAPIAIPYQGGPAYIAAEKAASEAAAAAEKKAAAQAGEQKKATMGIEEIDRALDIEANSILPVTGAVGAVTSVVPGTASHDVSNLLDTIRSHIGFDALNAMRQQSPTGGALGQVTERELELLQRTAGSVEQSQSPEQFRRNLERLRRQYLEVIHGPGGGGGVPGASGAADTAPDDEELLNKYAPR